MTNSRFIISTVAVFVVIFAFEYVYHGVLLMPTYEATASLWRPMTEMEQMMGWCLITKLAFAVLFTWLFGKHYENKGLHEGLRFGLYVGLIMGLTEFTSYMYLPIELWLAGAWFVGKLLVGLLVGATLSYTYKPKAGA